MPLTEYEHLIDLSIPSPTLLPTDDELDAAYGTALEYLDPEDALAHLDADTAVRALLTVRDPSSGPLPVEALHAIDAILAAKLTETVITKANTIPALTSLFPASGSTPAVFSKLAFFRGDITRISSPALAIVNAGNSALLGCFRPSHVCVDNVIHAAAGPRLRDDCYTIMQAQGRPEPEGRAKVTKGWSLPSGYVLHTFGPQLERGQTPTPDQEDTLGRCYTSCLDLAEEVGTIDAVAFPCISTGLFAFPGDVAARIALRAVDAWLAAHPKSRIRVIFTLFQATDVEHYINALQEVFGVAPPTKLLSPILPGDVVQAIRDADAIMIRAGAGLSADAVSSKWGMGLDYTDKKLFAELYPGLLKSTRFRCLYDTNVGWAFRLLHAHTILTWGNTPIYSALLSLAQSKPDHFVVTSNADRLFFQSGFDPARIYTAQGGYALLQCRRPCSPDAFFPIQPYIDRALPHISRSTMRFPTEELFEQLRPRCPRCGTTDVFLNVRGGAWFLQTPQEGERATYDAFLRNCAAGRKKLVLLELGCGFNTPSVIRWPGERMARIGAGKVTLVRVNGSARDARVPPDLGKSGTGFGLCMGAMEFLDGLKAQLHYE
ncbi:putative appr-1-p processing enzyme family protein [Mycena kentingensis (nom. inval.)]|nr:putative appr-1-p processing enzyme family protein [Mycena kentingensis (nom. inval.)]